MCLVDSCCQNYSKEGRKEGRKEGKKERRKEGTLAGIIMALKMSIAGGDLCKFLQRFELRGISTSQSANGRKSNIYSSHRCNIHLGA